MRGGVWLFPGVVVVGLEVGIRTGWYNSKESGALAGQVFEALKWVDSFAEWSSAQSLVSLWASGVSTPGSLDYEVDDASLICASFNLNEKLPTCDQRTTLALHSPLLTRVLDVLVSNNMFTPKLQYQSQRSQQEFDIISALDPHSKLDRPRTWYSMYKLDSNRKIIGAGITTDFKEGYENKMQVVNDPLVEASLSDLLFDSDVWRLSRTANFTSQEYMILHSDLSQNNIIGTFSQFTLNRPSNGFRFHQSSHRADEILLTDWTGSLILKNPEYKTINEIHDDIKPEAPNLDLKNKASDEGDAEINEDDHATLLDSPDDAHTVTLNDLVKEKRKFDKLGSLTIAHIRQGIVSYSSATGEGDGGVCKEYVVDKNLPKLSCLRGISANILSHLPTLIASGSAQAAHISKSIRSLDHNFRTRINGALVNGQHAVMLPSNMHAPHHTGQFFLNEFLVDAIMPFAIKDEILRQTFEKYPDDLSRILRRVTQPVKQIADDLYKNITNQLALHTRSNGAFSSPLVWKQVSKIESHFEPARYVNKFGTRFQSPYRDQSVATLKARSLMGAAHYSILLTGSSFPIEFGQKEPADFSLGTVVLLITRKMLEKEWLPDLLREVNSNGIHWEVTVIDDPAWSGALNSFFTYLNDFDSTEETETAAEAFERFTRILTGSGGTKKALQEFDLEPESETEREALISILANGKVIYQGRAEKDVPSTIALSARIMEILTEDCEALVKTLLGMTTTSSELLHSIRSMEDFNRILQDDGIVRIAAEGATTRVLTLSRIRSLKRPLSAQMLAKSKPIYMSKKKSGPLPLIPIFIFWNGREEDLKFDFERANLPWNSEDSLGVKIHIAIARDNSELCYPSSIGDDVSDLLEDLNCVGYIPSEFRDLPPDSRSSVVLGSLICPFRTEAELQSCVQNLLDRNVALLDQCFRKDSRCISFGLLRALSEAKEKSQIELAINHLAFSFLDPHRQSSDRKRMSDLEKELFNKSSLRFLRLSSAYSEEEQEPTSVIESYAFPDMKFLVDPLSFVGQIASFLAEYINLHLKLNVQILLTSDQRYSDLPLNRWTHHVMNPPLLHELIRNKGKAVRRDGVVKFANHLTEEILIFDVNQNPFIHLRSNNSIVDMDNLRLHQLHKLVASSGGMGGGDDVQVFYKIGGFRLEGVVKELRPEGEDDAVPGGAQLQMFRSEGSLDQEVIDETLTLTHPNYFQLVSPGIGKYRIGVRQGMLDHVNEVKSMETRKEIREFYRVDRNDTLAEVRVDSWRRIIQSREGALALPLDFKPVSDIDAKKGDSLSTPVMKNLADKNRIHVFSLASGHMYERLLRIMMLSARQNSKRPITFWILEDFLSSNFKLHTRVQAYNEGLNVTSSKPPISKDHIQINYVSYGWPAWVRAQTEKQRQIWARKILFLDLLFPLDLEQIIYVDADQIVRGDLGELWDMKMGATEFGLPYVYGFTPFCSDRPEMKEYRFWETGYWAQYLESVSPIKTDPLKTLLPERVQRYLPAMLKGWLQKGLSLLQPDRAKKQYHISALFKVNLREFRRQNVGDVLRSTYNRLTTDPESLANLDQDLPNSIQHLIPIYPLPMEWLWCETWCSMARKPRAKTIDLCNNPMTHEPKLNQARRIAPEWVAYDAHINPKFDQTPPVAGSSPSVKRTHSAGDSEL